MTEKKKPDIDNKNTNPLSEAQVETIEIDDEVQAELFDAESKHVPAHASFWSISLTLLELNIQILINLSGDLLIGRQADEVLTQNMFLDLAPYNAHQLGVSRRHAVLSLKDRHVSIRANETTNHTYLNDKRLIPDEEYPLKPGDVIGLGNLKVKFTLIFDPFAM